MITIFKVSISGAMAPSTKCWYCSEKSVATEFADRKSRELEEKGIPSVKCDISTIDVMQGDEDFYFKKLR